MCNLDANCAFVEAAAKVRQEKKILMVRFPKRYVATCTSFNKAEDALVRAMPRSVRRSKIVQ